MGTKVRYPRMPVCKHCDTDYWVRPNKKIVIRGNPVYECKRCGQLLLENGDDILPVEHNAVRK